jgi:uncharacterized protein
LALATFLLLRMTIAHAMAAEPQFPALTGRVVDEAHLLSPAAQDRVTGWLEAFENASKRQVVVVTVDTLQGLPIEDYGYRLGRFWGIGQKGQNTGAILLVAPKQRAVRIEVGYGLEGELTDAASKSIIENDILPAFRQGDYERGITAGTAAILRTLGWNGAGATGQAEPEVDLGDLVPILFFLVIILLSVGRYGRHGVWLLPMMGRDVWGSSSRRPFSGGGGSFGGGGASGRW